MLSLSISATSALAYGLLFILGAAHEALLCLYTQAVAKEKRKQAALLSGLLTAFGYIAWWTICWVGGGPEVSLCGVGMLALGSVVGTYLGFRVPAPS